MIDVVTFETAKRLKNAGFPQPDEIGLKVYYNILGAENTCLAGRLIHGQIFAPSATDILKEFFAPEDDGPFLYWSGQNRFWVCDFDIYTFDHENPAEACAAAWLSIHEKTTT
jgi:hypothetical protein